MSSTEPSGLQITPATPADLARLGDLVWVARQAAAPQMPALVRRRDEVVAHYRALRPDFRTEIWVARRDEAPERVIGFVKITDDWLDDLYVHPEAQGSGVGSALLDLACALRPDGFSLWVFETNLPARGFYARRGLVERERTDGSGNEEGAPDIRMSWPGDSAHPQEGVGGSI